MVALEVTSASPPAIASPSASAWPLFGMVRPAGLRIGAMRASAMPVGRPSASRRIVPANQKPVSVTARNPAPWGFTRMEETPSSRRSDEV